MSDIDRPNRRGVQPRPAETTAPPRGVRSLKPGELGADRMNPIREERAAAHEQIQRTLKAWRAAAGPAGRASVPKTTGAPLPDDVRSRLEPKLGANLGNARVHTGNESAEAARGFGARAFTVGDDVHFNAGEFRPGTREGDKLLAHELTHVVQGQKSGVQRKAAESEEKKGEDEANDGEPGRAAGDEGDVEVSSENEPAEVEADATAEKIDADEHGDQKTAEGDKDAGKDAEAEAKGASEAVSQEKPAPVAAKLMGIGRKVFRAEDDGAEPAEEQRGYPVHTPSGDYRLDESDMTAFIQEVARQILPEAEANQQAVQAMREKAEQYDTKYTTGWRGRGLQILGQQSPTIDLTLFDEAASYAANFVDALEAMECLDALNAAAQCGKNANAQRDLAIAELKRCEEMEGATSDAVMGNLQDMAGIAALSLAVGTLTSVAAQVALPALPAALIASKVVAAAAGAGAAGAASEMNKQLKRGASPEEVDAGKVIREALVQALPNALWGYLGGTVLSSLLVAKLPKELVDALGQRAAERIGSLGQSLVGLVPLSRAAQLLRGKPAGAPYDPNEMATEAAEAVDLPLLTSELEKEAPQKDQDSVSEKPPATNAPVDDGDSASEEEDGAAPGEAATDDDTASTAD